MCCAVVVVVVVVVVVLFYVIKTTSIASVSTRCNVSFQSLPHSEVRHRVEQHINLLRGDPFERLDDLLVGELLHRHVTSPLRLRALQHRAT